MQGEVLLAHRVGLEIEVSEKFGVNLANIRKRRL